MSDEPLDQNEGVPRRRPSTTGIALAALGALIFVGGTLLSLLSAGDDQLERPDERPSLSTLRAQSRIIVLGTSRTVDRVGEPRDAGVLATIAVESVEAPVEDKELEGGEVLIYDHGFREGWDEDQHMLLFLDDDRALPGGADYRVLERCILVPEGLPCPYDIERVGDG